MVTSSLPAHRAIAVVLLLASAPAWTREAASDAECQAVASQPPIAGAIAKIAANPGQLRSVFALADAWSDAGCFGNAVNVLQNAESAHPEDAELGTRLRVAKSLVREEHFFDDLDRADTQAKLKRAIFRCETLSDPAACGDAVGMRPDDAEILSAQGDAYMHSDRPRDALASYRRAAALAPETQGMAGKIHAAESAAGLQQAQSTQEAHPGSASHAPPKPYLARLSGARRYSNAAPAGQTH